MFGFPQVVRFSWSTAAKLLQDLALPIHWFAPRPPFPFPPCHLNPATLNIRYNPMWPYFCVHSNSCFWNQHVGRGHAKSRASVLPLKYGVAVVSAMIQKYTIPAPQIVFVSQHGMTSKSFTLSWAAHHSSGIASSSQVLRMHCAMALLHLLPVIR